MQTSYEWLSAKGMTQTYPLAHTWTSHFLPQPLNSTAPTLVTDFKISRSMTQLDTIQQSSVVYLLSSCLP